MIEKPNIVLIVFDTLRADYFQKYLENNLDFKEQLSDFTNFKNAYSPSPWTLPSHFSLFTGLYPSEHGIHEDPNSEMEDIFSKARGYSGNFLTNVAATCGYKTIGISANPMISSLTGFNYRFDEFHNINVGTVSGFENSKNNKDDKFIEKLINYITNAGIRNMRGFPTNKGFKIATSFFKQFDLSNSFFVFFNLMEMHDPYFKTLLETDDNKIIFDDLFKLKRMNINKVKKIKKIYYRQQAKVEYTISSIINSLKDKGKYNDTLIIITADHGQAIEEHNYYGHGIFLYDELIHIPMMVKLPGNFKTKVNKESYINLVNVYDIISSYIKGEMDSLKSFFREETFSESFGLQYSKTTFQNLILKPDIRGIYERLNIPRKAIIKNSSKLILNANSEIEEYLDYNNSIDNSHKIIKIKSLLPELEIFNIDKDFKIDENLIINTLKMTK